VLSSNSLVIPEAGPIVNPSPPAIDRLVHLTSMHGTFLLQCLQTWWVKDEERQEAGQADDLSYLVRATSMVMRITKNFQDLSRICTEQVGPKEYALKELSSIMMNLKGINMDLSDMENQAKLLHFQIHQLQACAASHDSIVSQLAITLEVLQSRTEAVMRAPGQVAGPSRYN